MKCDHRACNIIKTTLILSFLFLMISCSYQSYNSTEPDAYSRYWCKPENINKSLPNILANNRNEFDTIINEDCNQINH